MDTDPDRTGDQSTLTLHERLNWDDAADGDGDRGLDDAIDNASNLTATVIEHAVRRWLWQHDEAAERLR